MGSRLRDTVRFLFELFCEVSPGDSSKEPHIVKKYPESYKNEEELKNVPKFTFPCQLDSLFIQHYSFVLTSMDSKYTFCFCRYDPKANTSLVLLSHLPWHDTFYKLLNCIASIINSPEKRELPSFLEACRVRPLLGHTLKVTYNAGQSVFTCQNPDTKLPSIPDNCNLMEYFSAVDTKCMAGLWAALLYERRIAIVASKPSRLSACVQAANATLFPMSWQHIFIPILPKHLVDYLLAPMPFLIGVPRSVMESSVRLSEIGDVVILDVDANELRTPYNDLESLPPELVSSLKKALSDKHALGDTVSRAFLRALVCLIGGYRDAIRIEKGQLITFNAEEFVKTRKNMQPFLRKILQSQIFQQFIDERLDLLNSGRGFNDEFEVECNLYADKLRTGSGQRLKQQYKESVKTFKKEGGAFFKNVKDKVRQGGRNMKSAVKGLKSKIPKSSSRPSSTNTTDDSRFSCRSETPVSSDSDSTSASIPGPPREPPPGLPLDLLTEMEFLFSNKNTQRRDSFPNSSHNSELSLPDKAKTMSPNVPRLPARPLLPERYPIILTRKLVDLTDAPTPPPRAAHSQNSHFVSNITKNDESAPNDFHTSTICFADGKDKPKLKLTLSSNQRRLQQHNARLPNGSANQPCNSVAPRQLQDVNRLKGVARTATASPAPYSASVQEVIVSCCSDTDLIKLEDSPASLEDFDPIKSRKSDVDQVKSSTDSDLLHEYGLDFSQFNLLDCTPGSSSRPEPSSSVPPGWTTFN